MKSISDVTLIHHHFETHRENSSKIIQQENLKCYHDGIIFKIALSQEQDLSTFEIKLAYVPKLQ